MLTHRVKALLLHPEDCPRRGPWTEQHWDLVVDLGKSSESTARVWESELGCPVVRLESFRRCIEDPRAVAQILRSGCGRLLDREGLDWWELTSLLVHAELETVVALQRMALALSAITEVHATRRGWITDALEILLGRKITAYSRRGRSSPVGRLGHYSRLLQRFSFGQLAEIFLDKHDSDYRWRARLSSQRRGVSGPFILLPSAYTNVSRMAAAYARLVPELQFLLVYTRKSGKQFARPANISLISLAAYGRGPRHTSELAGICGKWISLRTELERHPEIGLLSRLGVLQRFEGWFSDGLAVRDAWLEVFRREPLRAVLCGDDSNWYTRLPVELGRKRGLPTIDFHHGAFDGRFLLKDLSSDIYLAKSEMELDYLTRVCAMRKERIVIGGPNPAEFSAAQRRHRTGSTIVFFSEPYEAAGGRAEEVYRELLPTLAALAVGLGRRLVIKLHPFESVPHRESVVRQVLSMELQRITDVRGGPLAEQLLEEAWFGITVESTTVIECAMRGIPCFIAGWMASSLNGYVQQYCAFGIGDFLDSAEQLATIPSLLEQKRTTTPTPLGGLWQAMDPAKLRGLFAGEYREEFVKQRQAQADY
jgi:hypothetical protein